MLPFALHTCCQLSSLSQNWINSEKFIPLALKCDSLLTVLYFITSYTGLKHFLRLVLKTVKYHYIPCSLQLRTQIMDCWHHTSEVSLNWSRQTLVQVDQRSCKVSTLRAIKNSAGHSLEQSAGCNVKAGLHWPCFEQGAKPDDLHWCLPGKIILWFCDYIFGKKTELLASLPFFFFWSIRFFLSVYIYL